jgi:hypothetical protein
LDIVRRRKTTPIHELERYMRCRHCSEVQGYPFKRGPPCCVATDQDFCAEPAFDVVAGRAIMQAM